jgi:cellulose synthase/poly-beta-1,6-N-acetylglucosamine synthase-like glycosyltransferase
MEFSFATSCARNVIRFVDKEEHRYDMKETLSTGPSIIWTIVRAFKANSIAFSDWLLNWTLAILVCSYYIVSTCIFAMCTEQVISVFYLLLMVVNMYVSATCAIEAFLSQRAVRTARKAALELKISGRRWKTSDAELPVIDIVIVAYLPNEKDIIREPVLYAVEELSYPKNKMRVNLVYNTPVPMEPLESELLALQASISNLRVIKAPGSESKAENLNYFLGLVFQADIIGIFDADHCPHPHNPRWAAERFLSDPSITIVQGRCVVYNTMDSFLAKIIAVEFDQIYAVSHPGRSRLAGFGLFCGSNGYCRADFLKRQRFNRRMLTEDIDAALRAYAKGMVTVHEMNVVSFELAPTTFKAFRRQRLRWAQGWTHASIKYLRLAWIKPDSEADGTARKRSIQERFGIVSLLLIRELS